ncbi:MAG: hypothetical protein WAV21_00200 [Minisyncoccia bacterium]
MKKTLAVVAFLLLTAIPAHAQVQGMTEQQRLTLISEIKAKIEFLIQQLEVVRKEEKEKQAQKREDQKEQNEKEKLCTTATKAKNEHEAKERKVTQKYNKEIEETKKNSNGVFGGALDQMVWDIERKKSSELADLSIEGMSILDNYNLYCHNYTASPRPSTYTPPTQTYCTELSSGFSCTSY